MSNNKAQVMTGNLNNRIAVLNRFCVPHDGKGNIDMDEWADRFDTVIENNELVRNINGKKRRAVSISSDYGAGWSTLNEGFISPVDARNNLFVLTAKELYKHASIRMISIIDQAREIKDLFYATHPDINREGLNVTVTPGVLQEVSIEWIDCDRKFIVDEYDGFESLTFADEIKWF